MTKQEAVKLFLEKFDLIPEQVDAEYVSFRFERLEEELAEYKRALQLGRPVDQIDALCDLVYVAIGNAIITGFDFDRHFDAVATANLDKERGIKKGRENSGGLDVIKPEGWVGPEIRHEVILASGELLEPVTEERIAFGNDG